MEHERSTRPRQLVTADHASLDRHAISRDLGPVACVQHRRLARRRLQAAATSTAPDVTATRVPTIHVALDGEASCRRRAGWRWRSARRTAARRRARRRRMPDRRGSAHAPGRRSPRRGGAGSRARAPPEVPSASLTVSTRPTVGRVSRRRRLCTAGGVVLAGRRRAPDEAGAGDDEHRGGGTKARRCASERASRRAGAVARREAGRRPGRRRVAANDRLAPRHHRRERALDLLGGERGLVGRGERCVQRLQERGALGVAGEPRAEPTLLLGRALAGEEAGQLLPLGVEVRLLRAIVGHAAETPEWKGTLRAPPPAAAPTRARLAQVRLLGHARPSPATIRQPWLNRNCWRDCARATTRRTRRSFASTTRGSC